MMVPMGLLTRMILMLKDTYTTVPKKNHHPSQRRPGPDLAQEMLLARQLRTAGSSQAAGRLAVDSGAAPGALGQATPNTSV